MPSEFRKPSSFFVQTTQALVFFRTHKQKSLQLGMPLSALRNDQFTEAFEIIGGKKAEISKEALADILRSLGQNPTNDEVTGLFNKHTNGSGVTLEAVLAAADEFEQQMLSSDQNAVLKEAFAVFDKDKSGKISAA